MNNNTESDKTIMGKMETLKHIHEVRRLLFGMIEQIDKRARMHDLSKLESPEKEIFGEHTPELAKCEYMSPEYKQLMEKVRPAIDHHYAKNTHHPEHFVNGINDMDLLDVLEMLVDWKAATLRNKAGNIRTSIDKNRERFKIDEQLTKILHNTVNKYLE